MIITEPLNTRTSFDPAAPGPDSNKHWAVSDAALSIFNLGSAAQQAHENALADAATYREYHLGLAQSVEEKIFVNRLADNQIKEAEARLATNLNIIREAAESAETKYHFFTAASEVEHCEGAWAFDAPAGFGDLSYQEQVTIALANKENV